MSNISEDAVSSVEEIRALFDSVSPVPTAAPLDPEDLRQRVEDANKVLEKEGNENPDLLHSSMIVFEQQRYYDVTRLYLFTEKAYENLTTIIGNATNVPENIKKAIGPFSNVAFPRTIDIDEPPQSIKVSILDRDSMVEVEIIINYFTGKQLKFSSFFQY